MNLSRTSSQVLIFFKEIYKVWFPWLDIAILAVIYLFLWGDYINPYHQYQLIKYGQTTTGKIYGGSELYDYPDAPRKHDLEYSFTLPNGEIINSSTHTYIPKELIGKRGKLPINAAITYLPNQPEINSIKSNLPENIKDFLKRNLIYGLLFILTSYLVTTIIMRILILDHRAAKQMKTLKKQERTIIHLPKTLLN